MARHELARRDLAQLRHLLGAAAIRTRAAGAEAAAGGRVDGRGRLAEPDGEGLRYRAVNACITPLGSLHGRQLLTVESLAEGERLHPVQQAIVDCHGAQCGFCTPGIVMSLFAWRHAACAHDRESALTALSGNLCRCTGYRPILEAARRIAGDAHGDRFSAAERATAERLRALPAGASLDDGEQHAWLPTTLEELDTLLMNYPQARLVAGATDLALEATQALKRFPQLIHLERVAELRRLEEHPDHLLIGAARPYADCLEALRAFPGVPELLERLGSLQIRQRGSLGGERGDRSQSPVASASAGVSQVPPTQPTLASFR